MKITYVSIISFIFILSLSCSNSSKNAENSDKSREALDRINAEDFEKEIDGKTYKLFELRNDNGMIVRFTNTGAAIVQLIVPDKNGNFDDIALGYKTLEEYLVNPMYHGCIVGRFGNRIAKGKFTLNGVEYQLALNNNGNSLHGGVNGFHTAYWNGEISENSIKFNYISEDMEEGYPGELKVEVIYSLNNQNELKIQYSAETNDSTIINLTNHTYWNLNGEANTDILDHQIMIPAEYITPVDEGLIPYGNFMSVENTPFDFRELRRIGDSIDSDHEQIRFGGGYDHNFVLAMEDSNDLHLAAKLVSELSGRKLSIFTTEPGIQFYSGNFMDGSFTGKNGKKYDYRHALALETQHFPDSPNQENFPSTLLVPGEKYESVTVFQFDTE
jgi:aldose 1-epimerase